MHRLWYLCRSLPGRSACSGSISGIGGIIIQVQTSWLTIIFISLILFTSFFSLSSCFSLKDKLAEDMSSTLILIPDNSFDSKGWYAGVKRCRECHLEKVEAWAKTSHATALELLPSPWDSGCLRCHTTGIDGIRQGNPKDFENVQCEACHGPLGDHSLTPESLGEGCLSCNMIKTCIRCHSRQRDPDFIPSQAIKGVIQSHG